MKKQLYKLVITALILGSSLGAKAGTWLCYVQGESSEGIYNEVLAKANIAADDYEIHILLQEGDYRYTVSQSEKDGKIQVAMFNQKDKASLVLAVSNSIDGITLLNAPTKKLIGCSTVEEKKK